MTRSHVLSPCSVSWTVDDVSLEVAGGVHVSEDDWVGLLGRDDVGCPDVGCSKSVSAGHDIGHSHGVINLNKNN